jgi:hypothetical protein
MRLFCCGSILAALSQRAGTRTLNHCGQRQRAARPFRGSARSLPGVFTSPVTLTLSFTRSCLLQFSTLLYTPRQHHELARVRPYIVVLGSNSEFHLRFKKSMNRAGTTVRMEPLVSPSTDNLPYHYHAYPYVAPPKNRTNRAYSRPRLCVRGGEIQSVRCPRSGS